MKVLAINGSPRGKFGNTDIVLQSLLIGMRETGCSVETIYLNKVNIKPCAGCLSCWFKTPGKCIYEDDVRQLLPKLAAADLIIYATPLFVYSMTGLLKNFLDRTTPLDSPFFAENNKTTDPDKNPQGFENNKDQKVFLISSAGFPELKHFEPLIHTFKYTTEILGLRYLGEILKPAAALLKMSEMRDKVAAYQEDLKIAGRQLAEQEMISEYLLTKLHELWITPEEYWRSLNSKFREMLG